MLGLPFAFASHFAPSYLDTSIKIFRDKFKASDSLKESSVMAAVNVFAADTDDEAKHLFTWLQLQSLAMIRGNPIPFPAPVEDIDSYGVCLKKKQ